LAKLEELGLIERHAPAKDKRVREATASDKGRATIRSRPRREGDRSSRRIPASRQRGVAPTANTSRYWIYNNHGFLNADRVFVRILVIK